MFFIVIVPFIICSFFTLPVLLSFHSLRLSSFHLFILISHPMRTHESFMQKTLFNLKYKLKCINRKQHFIKESSLKGIFRLFDCYWFVGKTLLFPIYLWNVKDNSLPTWTWTCCRIFQDSVFVFPTKSDKIEQMEDTKRSNRLKNTGWSLGRKRNSSTLYGVFHFFL